MGETRISNRSTPFNRRGFLQASLLAPAGLILTDSSPILAEDAPPADWRTFEITTRVEVANPSGDTRIWVPTPLTRRTPYQGSLATRVKCDGGTMKAVENRADALKVICAHFPAGKMPVVTVTSRVTTRNWAVSLSERGSAAPATRAELNYFLRSTKFVPTGGIVKQKATEITRGATSDLDKARAIYEWIVENTYRNPKTRGCGLGNIRFMLESGDLSGKCADLNALYVGLARAAGLPARDVYGIRVAASGLGYKSLGAASENVTKAQHCRAEVYLNEFGWVPVDPADVRKVMLEEPPGNRPIDDDMVKRARARLFGSWEMNWIGYNFGQEVPLAGSNGQPLPFLMYPQAETSEGRLDCLDPDNFKYQITAKGIA